MRITRATAEQQPVMLRNLRPHDIFEFIDRDRTRVVGGPDADVDGVFMRTTCHRSFIDLRSGKRYIIHGVRDYTKFLVRVLDAELIIA